MQSESSPRTITYDDIKPILDDTCTQRCHRKGKKAEWSPLTSYKEIIDGKAVMGKDCEDTQYKNYVVAGKPMESLLYLKLLNRPPCGKRMPRGSRRKPTEKEIDMIRQWIEQGALAESKSSMKND